MLRFEELRRKIVLFWIVLASAPALAAPFDPYTVPEPLHDWIPWVRYGHESRACPFLANDPDDRRCAWPLSLELNLDATGGTFSGSWRVYSATWAALPGDAETWPQAVEVDGRPGVVIARATRPGIGLEPGHHRVRGRFLWSRLPETFPLPETVGPIRLTVDGRPVPLPAFDARGHLWLRKAPPAAASASLMLEVSRLLRDAIPLQLVTQLQLDVSGEPREIALEGALLPEFVPLALDSPLPARLEADGRLRFQVQPGRWVIRVMARATSDLAELALPRFPSPWPNEELWSFAADRSLRVVELAGPPLIDPRLTRLPEEWKALPTYAMRAGGSLQFRLIRRGDPDPEPDDLRIHRIFWLDFQGHGLTVLDDITGRITRDWRMEALPGLELGRVTLDDQPQTITRRDEHGPWGVEVRRGELKLRAESRWSEAGFRLPAGGWDKDFREARAELHLPPGWRLIAALGADRAPGSWIGRWTLLDLFLVLITSLAAARLWGFPVGALALLTLVLLWHEPDAPRGVWLGLLAVTALERAMPSASWTRGVRALVLVALVLSALPFAVQQLRQSLYPQLEPYGVAEVPPPYPQEAVSLPTPATTEAVPLLGKVEPSRRKEQGAPGPEADVAPRPPVRRGVDPDALTQTGPGLPEWTWSRIDLAWNGPVLRDQHLQLLLIPPGVTRLLNLLRVALLAVLAVALLGWLRRPWPRFPVFLLGLFLTAPDGQAQGFPPPALLEELKTRWLSPPECGTACAEIASLRLKITKAALRAELEAHAEILSAIPLPATGQWVPAEARIDGQAAALLVDHTSGNSWLALEPGVHRIELSGPLPALAEITLPLPLKPHRVEIESEGFDVQGVGRDGVPEAQIRLRRRGPAPTAALEPAPLPPFFTVERTLVLGLDWGVTTRVNRLSPADVAVTVEIPLLPGESVLTPSVKKAEHGTVSIHLPAGVTSTGWESTLGPTSTLEFRAPQTPNWTEIWRADIGPLWHVEFSGIPVVHHQDAAGNWLPEWRPWPGESLRLTVERPPAAPGNALTIEGSMLEMRPGLRATDVDLTLKARSAKGGQHVIRLPPGAVLQAVRIDGIDQPIRQREREVTLPLRPGEQHLALSWRSPEGVAGRLQSPPVDLGAPSVNARIAIQLGSDRWILGLGGPMLGPAVLFWGNLGVIVLLALGLGRLRHLPLKARHWLLLLIGLSQVPLAAGLVVVGWFLALDWRRRVAEPTTKAFNLLQVGLGLLTLFALATLLAAVRQGLLGLPEMQIIGPDHDPALLRWYADRSGPQLPRAWAVSLPLFAYRLLMLAWALWLAYALIDWLRWGWECFSAGGLWRPRSERAASTSTETHPPPGDPQQPQGTSE
ncbi:MAG TPA: hypothetical protein VNL74_04305 [Methylococcus sp.]|nr:hypothetical protein [Methylococcus sp.]